VVVADQLAQILRVMTGRERGRAHEIAEHYSKLTVLGAAVLRRFGLHRPLGCRGGSRSFTKIAAGLQQLQSMSKRDTEPL
jgi:hypothetical protein